MNSTNGTEGRFKARFSKYAGTSENFSKHADATGNAIDDLRTSVGMINEQKKGIDQMFVRAERAVVSISQLERESGEKQVDNIPLPTDTVRDSYGKKMGYVTLSLEFVTEGMLHFMEQVLDLQHALDSRERVISQMAAHIPKVEVIGGWEEVTVSDLSAPLTIDVQTYAKNEKPIVASPSANGKKASKK